MWHSHVVALPGAHNAAVVTCKHLTRAACTRDHYYFSKLRLCKYATWPKMKCLSISFQLCLYFPDCSTNPPSIYCLCIFISFYGQLDSHDIALKLHHSNLNFPILVCYLVKYARGDICREWLAGLKFPWGSLFLPHLGEILNIPVVMFMECILKL